jgi:cysteine desulfuration protein SufE
MSPLPPRLDEMITELAEADRQERIELLIDLAKTLRPLPERLESHRDATHRVAECQSPVYLFVEPEDEVVRIHADAPIEAPTVRGFVCLLIEGLDGLPADQILNVPSDLMQRAGLAELLGMQRMHGLGGVLRRLKAEVTRVANPT